MTFPDSITTAYIIACLRKIANGPIEQRLYIEVSRNTWPHMDRTQKPAYVDTDRERERERGSERMLHFDWQSIYRECCMGVHKQEP